MLQMAINSYSVAINSHVQSEPCRVQIELCGPPRSLSTPFESLIPALFKKIATIQKIPENLGKLWLWGLEGLGGHFTLNVMKRIAQKLR